MGYKDTMMVEGADGYEANDEMEYFSAVQRQINEGQWSLQGSHGREMMRCIKAGDCMLGKNGARDYWGSYVPSRDEVKAGTFGSADYVREMRGEEWADHMEAL